MKNKHHAAIYLLTVISLATLFAYFSGAFTVRVSIMELVEEDDVLAPIGENYSSNVEYRQTKFKSKCDILTNPENAYCGIYLKIFEDDAPELGLDFSVYDGFTIGIKPTHKFADPRVKITFKHFSPEYSFVDDPISSKFNSVLLDIGESKGISSSDEEQIYEIPFDFFQVDTWWINDYNISVQDAQVDLSNIVQIEIINQKVEQTGLYSFEITSFEAVKERFSLTQILSVILLLAVAIIFLLINEQRKVERGMSLIDPLTKLHNRRGQMEWLKKLKISPSNPQLISLIYMDIDDFKHTNDTYGHYVGDLLLQQFSQKVTQVLSRLKLDKNKVDFCRLSGDEFIIVGSQISREKAELIAKTLLDTLQKAVVLNKNKIVVNISIGIALDTLESMDIKSLFTRADCAMYFAKRLGKNQSKTYDDEVIAKQTSNQDISKLLKEAIDQSAFSLLFLPIFDIQTKQVASVEVLLQTEHPGLQSLSLDEYLSIAEQTGLIKDIDSWLIETSLEALAKHKEFIGNLNLQFYLRISLVDIQNDTFVASLSARLAHYDIPASWLVLVIKETPPKEENDLSVIDLQAIRDLGVNFALSHFGTGHTALERLLDYPIGHLKIDERFVKYIGDKERDTGVIVKAIMSVAESYQIDVIAEGVETLDQFYFLKDLGCNLIQGDLFSGPLDAKGLTKALKNQHS